MWPIQLAFRLFICNPCCSACCLIFPIETLPPPGDPNGGVVYLWIVLSPEETSRICISVFGKILSRKNNNVVVFPFAFHIALWDYWLKITLWTWYLEYATSVFICQYYSFNFPYLLVNYCIHSPANWRYIYHLTTYPRISWPGDKHLSTSRNHQTMARYTTRKEEELPFRHTIFRYNNSRQQACWENTPFFDIVQ